MTEVRVTHVARRIQMLDTVRYLVSARVWGLHAWVACAAQPLTTPPRTAPRNPPGAARTHLRTRRWFGTP